MGVEPEFPHRGRHRQDDGERRAGGWTRVLPAHRAVRSVGQRERLRQGGEDDAGADGEGGQGARRGMGADVRNVVRRRRRQTVPQALRHSRVVVLQKDLPTQGITTCTTPTTHVSSGYSFAPTKPCTLDIQST